MRIHVIRRQSCASRQLASGWPKQHITGITTSRQAGRPVHALESTRGTLPAELGLLTVFTALSFGANQLTGTVPTELGALTELTWLDLYHNKLTGTVPALPFKQYTKNCSLSPNKFSCPLPVDAAACICVGEPGVVCN
jgi:hypothetical protein